MAGIIVEGGTVVTVDAQRRIIKDGAVYFEGDTIVDVGKASDLKRKHKADQKVDAKGKLVLPGLIDTHLHMTQMLARGLADDIDLIGWMHERIWPYESVLTDDDVYKSATLCSLEMIKTGTTAFADPGGYRMEHVARAVEKAGLKGILSWASIDVSDPLRPVPKNLLTTTDEAVRKNEELIRNCHGKANGRIRVWGGLRVEPNASSNLIKRINDLAKKYGTGVEMHAAVNEAQVEWIKKREGKTMVEYLDSLGVLGPHWMLIHMGWINDKEVQILKARDVAVSHVPGASMFGAYGSISHGKFPELIKAGVRVGLGCDSSAADNSIDMFRAMYLGNTAHKDARLQADLISPEKTLEMATIDAARVLHWENEIGSLEPGKKADIIVVNIKKSNWVPMHDFSIVPCVVYSGEGKDVDTTIVNGKILMENRKVTTLNEEKVLEESQEAAETIVARAGLDKKIKPRWPIQ